MVYRHFNMSIRVLPSKLWRKLKFIPLWEWTWYHCIMLCRVKMRVLFSVSGKILARLKTMWSKHWCACRDALWLWCQIHSQSWIKLTEVHPWHGAWLKVVEKVYFRVVKALDFPSLHQVSHSFHATFILFLYISKLRNCGKMRGANLLHDGKVEGQNWLHFLPTMHQLEVRNIPQQCLWFLWHIKLEIEASFVWGVCVKGKVVSSLYFHKINLEQKKIKLVLNTETFANMLWELLSESFHITVMFCLYHAWICPCLPISENTRHVILGCTQRTWHSCFVQLERVIWC